MDTQMNGAHGDLRLQPQAIPQLKVAYQQALTQLEGVLADAKSGFRIERPAMMDDASVGFQTAFNGYAADGAGSIREQLAAFERRLRETVDRLGAIQQAHDRNETAIAATLSRQLEP
jgi:hypothetical protein